MQMEIIGQQWKADFGSFVFQLDFYSETLMGFRSVLPNGSLGEPTTVDITRTELRKNLWLVSWSEPTLGATVVHVQDFEDKRVWTHISMFEEKQFVRETGHLTKWAA